MKKILSFLGTTTLIGTSAINLVACNKIVKFTPEELIKLKEKNKINTTDENIKKNLEWTAPQESPFNNIGNKLYFVIWRGNKNHDWRIVKFKHISHQIQLDKYDNYILTSSNDQKNLFNLFILKGIGTYYWIKFDNGTYFKSVYRWDSGGEPNIPIIDPKTGEVIDWKEDKEVKEDKEDKEVKENKEDKEVKKR